MKCEIICDLLPLYIENLCSGESREEVARHLEECPGCRSAYERLNREFCAAKGESEKLCPAAEKELLEKSRATIRRACTDKILRVIFAVIFTLSLLCNLGMFAVVIFGAPLKYPKVYFGGYGWGLALFVPFLPTAVGLAGLLALRNKKLLSRLLAAFLIPAVLAGAVYTGVFMIFPPLRSETRDADRYLELEEGLEREKALLISVFPSAVPENAAEISYHYIKYSALFSDTVSIEASWRLSGEAYMHAKELALASPVFENSGGDFSGQGSVSGMMEAGKIRLEFTYDDRSERVSYLADMDLSR